MLQLSGDAGRRQVPNAKLGLIQMIGAGVVCLITNLEQSPPPRGSRLDGITVLQTGPT